MRIIPAGEKYESRIWVNDETKLILKIDCKCPDFNFRRIKKVGEGVDAKRYANPCKHLKSPVQALERLNYKLKVPKEMEGSNKMTNKLKRQIVKRSNGNCEVNGCSEKAIQFHRIIRKSNGGKYTYENVKHLCSTHHKFIHGNEFPGVKGK